MEGFNARGSFGVPEHIKKQLEQSARPKPEVVASPPQPEVAPPTAVITPEQKEDDKKQMDLAALREHWEKRLSIKLTEKDIHNYIFKGKLIKEDIEIIPDVMKVVFQSVTAAELAEIDQSMAEFREGHKWTTDGLSNENALRVLSYGWIKTVEIEDGVAKPARLMGNTHSDRYKTISQISALAVQEVIEAWDVFNILIKIALREKRILKK
jgi:hypothetical protein